MRKQTLRVTVAHGAVHLARSPVALGRFIGEGLSGFELSLDQHLHAAESGPRLGPIARWQHMQLLPTERREVQHLRVDTLEPSGVLLIGLGRRDELTGAVLRECFRLGFKSYLAGEASRSPDVALTALMRGTGHRGLPTSVVAQAVVEAMLLALNDLRRAGLHARVHLELLEPLEGRAIRAWHAVRSPALQDLATRSAVELRASRALRTVEGGHRGEWVLLPRRWSRLEIREHPQGFSLCLRTAQGARPLEVQLEAAPLEYLQRLSRGDAVVGGREAETISRALLPTQLIGLLQEADGLVLDLDKAAASLPWEALEIFPEERGRFAQTAGVVRMLRGQRAEGTGSAAIEPSALVIGNPWIGHDRDEESQVQQARAVENHLKRRGLKVTTRIGHQRAKLTLDLVKDALLGAPWGIVHVSAHGRPSTLSTDGERRPTGILVHRRNPVTDEAEAAELDAAVFRQMSPPPRLVFINACSAGAVQAEDPSPLAEALVSMGVPMVVVAAWPIGGAPALAFAEAFYEHLLRPDGTFGVAVTQGRRAAAECSSSSTWSAYQAYGAPHATLWDTPDEGRVGRDVPSVAHIMGVSGAEELLEELTALRSGMVSGVFDVVEVRSLLDALKTKGTATALGEAIEDARVQEQLGWLWLALSEPDDVRRCAKRALSAGGPRPSLGVYKLLLDADVMEARRMESEPAIRQLRRVLERLGHLEAVFPSHRWTSLRAATLKLMAQKQDCEGTKRRELLEQARDAYQDAWGALQAQSQPDDRCALQAALLELGLGDHEAAARWLERAEFCAKQLEETRDHSFTRMVPLRVEMLRFVLGSADEAALDSLVKRCQALQRSRLLPADTLWMQSFVDDIVAVLADAPDDLLERAIKLRARITTALAETKVETPPLAVDIDT